MAKAFFNSEVAAYCEQIKKYPLLTREEEIKHSKVVMAYKSGKKRERAVEALILGNLRFVVTIAQVYPDYLLPHMDLIMEGNDGLRTAAERFDWRIGAKFSTYAAWWIKQAIKRAISNKSRIIRLPVHVTDRMYKIYQAEAKLRLKLSRDPTLIEVGKELDMRPEEIERWKKVYEVQSATISIHAPVSQETDDSTLQDIIPDENSVSADEAAMDADSLAEIEEVLRSLDPRERDIIKKRFGIGCSKALTLEEVAAPYEITRERIRQIQNKAMRKIRRRLESRLRERGGKLHMANDVKRGPVMIAPPGTKNKYKRQKAFIKAKQTGEVVTIGLLHKRGKRKGGMASLSKEERSVAAKKAAASRRRNRQEEVTRRLRDVARVRIAA